MLNAIERPAFIRYKILFTAFITMLLLSLLLWEYFHGGVPGHHILQDKDLPKISNWWGALMLPLLTWLMTSRTEKRMYEKASNADNDKQELFATGQRLLVGLLFGLALAISFTNDFKFFLDNILYVVFILCLLMPVYYAEFILGFVLGMTYTFGAILPTAFVLIIAGLGFLLFKFIRPLLIKLIGFFRRRRYSSNKISGKP
jgi:hypothetical protein